jgi:hypothetical protein
LRKAIDGRVGGDRRHLGLCRAGVAPNSPITVNGLLKTTPTTPEVDFYKISGGTPGDILCVHLTKPTQ